MKGIPKRLKFIHCIGKWVIKISLKKSLDMVLESGINGKGKTTEILSRLGIVDCKCNIFEILEEDEQFSLVKEFNCTLDAENADWIVKKYLEML